MSRNRSREWRASLWLAVATAASIFVLLGLLGVSPGVAARELVVGSFGSSAAVVATLRSFVPLCLCALGVAFAFRVGLWNIGAEGQFIVGSIAAFAMTQWVASSIMALLAGAAAGAIWAGLPAALRITRQVPEVLATIMLNFIALEALRFGLRGPLQESSGQFLRSDEIPVGAQLPEWHWSSSLSVHAGLFLTLALIAGASIFLRRTKPGLLLRAVGSNPRAVQAAGFSKNRLWLATFSMSGALAGLAGAVQLTAVSRLLDSSVANGTGYVAIAVALLAGLRPFWIVPAALLFAALSTGTASLQWAADLPGIDRFARIAEAVILLGVLWRTGRVAQKERPKHG